MNPRYENKTYKTEQYSVSLCMDYFNERLRIVDYTGDIDLILQYIQEQAQEYGLSKIIFLTKQEHWQTLLSNGYELEAIFKGYLKGLDAYAMTSYKVLERRISKYWVKEDVILDSILKKGRVSNSKPTPNEYILRRANKTDAIELASLYDKVFDIYPTPMNKPDYLKEVMENGSIFYIAERNKKIVSAASADVNNRFHHAELTDCATLPEHRKYGLMKKLLIALEEQLIKQGIYCAFSIARALSFGMNAAFYQLGYDFMGRMANNCYIYDKMEDMNVWVKKLNK